MKSIFVLLGRCAAAAIVVAMVGVAAGRGALAHDEEESFIASWAVGHINPLPAGTLRFNNQTLREVVRASAGGDLVRVRISDTFGSNTLVIGEAHIAASGSGSKILAGTDRVLTFGGQRSVNVYAGSPVLSDPVRLEVKPLTELAVSIYLPNTTDAETSTLFQGNSFVSLSSGNHAAAV